MYGFQRKGVTDNLSSKWVVNVLDALDRLVDEETRIKVLESCGRKCIGAGFLARAEVLAKKSKNPEDFLEKLSKVWKHLHVDKNGVFVVYEQCYCPMVKAYRGELSPSFCNCSVGWIKELFERSLNKPVKVEKLGTVKQGSKQCTFRVTL